MDILILVAIVAAGALAAFDVISSRGRSILGWAVLLLAFGLLLPRLT